LDWSSLGSVAELRPYREGDRDAVLSFSCTTPGLNFTCEAQHVIRSAPDLVGEVADDEVWIGWATIPRVGIVGVVVYHGQVFGVTGESIVRPFIAALGIRRDYRRRGIGTSLKIAAMRDMADRGLVGPTVSLVDQRNHAMLQLNTTRFEAKVEPDPDVFNDRIAMVSIEPVD